MHGADAPAWAHWLEASELGSWARQSSWGYASANILHLLGLATIFGSILGFDLRMLGVASVIRAADLARFLLPVARWGFALTVLSGLVLLSADASHVVVNPAFQVKVGLIALALLNALVFHRVAGLGREPASRSRIHSTLACVSAALSLLLWASVIVCGRLIAYL